MVVVASALWFSFSFLLIAFCSLLLLLFVLVKGAHGQHPSVILDRAKKKLLDDMSLKTKASPVRPLGSVSADLIDPSKSPFAQGMNRKDMAELRNRIPGMKKLKQQKVESVLDLEVKASTDANRDARLAALSMLNE